MTISWNSLTTDELPIDISLLADGVYMDLSVYPLQIALPVHGSLPTVWFNGTWNTDTSTQPPTYTGQLLVGPSGGLVTVQSGVVYDIWWSVAISPTTVIRFFDLLLVR